MSSAPLQKITRSAARILEALKRSGPLTAAELGERLGVSGEAARQQLQRLAAEGLVAAESAPAGVGRPSLRWQLTAAATARFPDGSAELAGQLLRALPREALESALAQRAAEVLAKYEAALASREEVPARVAALAALRTGEGYMAEWYAEGAAVILVENHCPICILAAQCPGLCRDELQIFRALFAGRAEVQREELLTEGGRRCLYRITPLPRV